MRDYRFGTGGWLAEVLVIVSAKNKQYFTTADWFCWFQWPFLLQYGNWIPAKFNFSQKLAIDSTEAIYIIILFLL